MLQSKNKKILFLGFSVTAESPGYFGFLDSMPNVELHKVGIGGIQPHHLQFFIQDEINKYSPDYVVLEISTAGFRSFLKKEEYFFAVLYMINVILRSNAVPIILDLPRGDIDYSIDWVTQFHSNIALEFGVPYINLCGDEDLMGCLNELLRDGIHTTEQGAQFFANKININLKDIVEKTLLIDIFNPIDEFGNKFNLNCNSLAVKNNSNQQEYKEFKRSGYSDIFVILDSHMPLRIDFNEIVNICGISYLMGPETSQVSLNFNNNKIKNIITYDQFCYYTRLGITMFEPLLSEKVVIESSDAKPIVNLQKGDVSLNSPVNYINRIFYISNEHIREKKNILLNLSKSNIIKIERA
jgi:hypothetical protein